MITCPALALKWPDDQASLDKVARGFETKSDHGLMNHCVGAIDGILIKILQPRNVPNPRDYFSAGQCFPVI